jgi:MFS family permease
VSGHGERTAGSTLTDHDLRRLRTMWRVAAAGPLLGVLAAAGVALIGLSGRAGLAALLVCSALGLVVAALLASAQALVDEWARRPVARRRLLSVLGLFAGSALLMLFLGGLSGGG